MSNHNQGVILARVSTRGQRDNYSFLDQQGDAEAYAARMDIEVAKVFTFVHSATKSLGERKDLDEVFAFVEDNPTITALILGKLDRLSRRVGTLAAVWSFCRKHKVSLHFADHGKAEESATGKLLLQTLEGFAEFEADRIRERMEGGRQRKLESGKIIGHGPVAPYGLAYEGQGSTKQLVIHEDHARIVRLCRDWLLVERLGTPAIAKRLSAMGILTAGTKRTIKTQKRSATEWTAQQVYRLVTNPAIAGMMFHNRLTASGKRRDRSEWIGIEIPAIITQADFDAIQQRLAQNRAQAKPGNSKAFYLLGRLIRCAHCGNAMSAARMPNGGNPPIRYYRCMSKWHTTTRCEMSRNVPADRLEDAVWNWLIDDLSADKLRLGLLAEREKRQQAQQRSLAHIGNYEQQKAELGQRVKRAEEAYLAGVFSVERLRSATQELHQQIASMESELKALQTGLADPGPSDQDIAELVSAIEMLKVEAASMDEGEARRVLLDKLDLRVRVEFVEGAPYAHISYRVGSTDRAIPLGSKPLRISQSQV